MNIFVTSSDPVVCAQELDDKRLVKMTLETTQILSTVMHLSGYIGPYKVTHQGHPVVKWAGVSDSNFKWTVSLLREMCKEYTFRYSKIHKCQFYISIFDTVVLRNGDMSEFADCSNSDGNDIYSRYRNCLTNKWANDKRPPKWTKRNKPNW